MEAASYWSSYMIQMLAAQFALAYEKDDLAIEYRNKANAYFDQHFEAIDRHLDNLREYNNG